MGHVGDGDHRTPAALIVRRGIGPGPDRVVEVAGVRAVDGHQGQRPQVGAALQGGRLLPLGLGQRLVGEVQRQAVGVDGREADRAGRVHIAQPLDHPGVGQAEAAALAGLAHHQLAGPRAGGLARLHREVAAGTAPGGLDHAPAPAVGVKDPDHPAGAGIEHAHGPRQVTAVGCGPDACQHAVADARLRHAAGGRDRA